MSRTTRLQDLIRVLRHHTGPIGGPELAERLGIPLRTLYQDIAALRAVGVDVVNVPNQGYVLPSEVTLPPTALAEPAPREPAELIFYTHPLSRGGIVHWMLEELGVPYRTVLLEYGTTMKSPDYLALNPMGKVPAIRHGDAVVTEAAAICAYLADAFPEAGLAPPIAARGDYYRWLFFAAGPLETAIALNNLGLQPTVEQQGQLGCGDYWVLIDTLASAVDGRLFIAGDAFSAADVYVGSHIGWGMHFGTLPRRAEFEAYWAALRERPALQRCEAYIEQVLAEG
ncbi:glutathione S-transferase N-terminal domain-containing protein [Halomonas sp. TRM85114]|uniref:glutathione S-transferase N-terminal domain-containing protein n=1 Tax=Halomonas jincaotanensis TaxID=2810616 RepID=UPI001BD21E8B|nr:glutathione S-transferase N-terminal domain-containing protein [Halomonas jincaotanensis]MBS9404577.1 glutathione S-transferase N-terminal domain-containing protein [Halomonas jincaotanensis]